MLDASHEYNALRSEILKRIEIRQQMLSVALTIAGVFLGVGITTGAVALIYPPLAMFLALGWAQNDARIADIGIYIRTHMEPGMPGLNWETYSQQRRESAPWKGWRFTVLSHAGVFVVTQIMALGVGLFRFTATPIEWTLLVLDGLSILLVLRVMSRMQRV